MDETHNVTKHAKIYLCFFISLIIFSIILSIATNGISFNSFLFADDRAVFSDFFDVMDYSRNKNLYLDVAVQYPPFSILLLRFFGSIIPNGLNPDVPTSVIKFSQIGLMIYILFVLFCALLEIIVVFLYESNKKWITIPICVVITLNIPFIFAFTRGNILLLGYVLSSIFIGFYNSKNKVAKEIALISLALAFNVKLTPAIFGFILLKERKWIEIFKVVSYSLIIFFFSILFFNNPIESSFMFIKNLFTWGSALGDLNKSVDFITTIRRLFTMVFHSSDGMFMYKFSKVLVMICLALSVLGLFFEKNRTYIFITLSVIVAAFSELSFAYNYVYLIFPFVLFLNIMNLKNVSHIFYAIAFFLVLGLFTFSKSYVTVMEISDTGTIISTQMPIVLLGIGGTMILFISTALSCKNIFAVLQKLIVNTRKNKTPSRL